MTPTTTEIMNHLDLSPRQLKALQGEGVIRQGMTLDECRMAYIRHLRYVASGQRPHQPDRLDRDLDRLLDRMNGLR